MIDGPWVRRLYPLRSEVGDGHSVVWERRIISSTRGSRLIADIVYYRSQATIGIMGVLLVQIIDCGNARSYLHDHLDSIFLRSACRPLLLIVRIEDIVSQDYPWHTRSYWHPLDKTVMLYGRIAVYTNLRLCLVDQYAESYRICRV